MQVVSALPCKEAKQVLMQPERILGSHPAVYGCGICSSQFCASPQLNLAQVQGRCGVEGTGCFECQSGWNSMTTAARHHLWHAHASVDLDLVIHWFTAAVGFLVGGMMSGRGSRACASTSVMIHKSRNRQTRRAWRRGPAELGTFLPKSGE